MNISIRIKVQNKTVFAVEVKFVPPCRLVGRVVLVVAIIATAVMPLASQTPPAEKPSFEVASVKPNKSVDAAGGRSNLDQPGGNVTITKFSLRMLMAQAYDLPSL